MGNSPFEFRSASAALHLRPDDRSFENQITVNQALVVAADSAMAGPDSLGEHQHALAGENGLAKFCVLDAAKSDEPLPADELPAIEAGKLCGTFDH